MERIKHLRIPSGSRSDSGIDGGCSSSLDSATSSITNTADSYPNKLISANSEKDGSDSLSTISNIKSEEFKTNPSSSKNDSESTFDCQSPESLEDDWSRIESNLTVNKSFNAPAKTKNESNVVDERNRYSPVEFPAELQADESYETTEDNNKSFRRAIENIDRCRLSSKEEKQRQNEEIVIMESSSVSSETGSWESVFPQRTITDLKESSKTFLNNERTACLSNSSRSAFSDDMPVISNQQIPDNQTNDVKNELEINIVPKPTSSLGACFIDASTLLDESEIAYSSFSNLNPASGQSSTIPINIKENNSHQQATNITNETVTDVWAKKEPIQKLENFHKDFQLCKVNKPEADDISSSKYSGHTSEEAITTKIPNLSDEQKLNKRDVSHEYDIKDQFSYNSARPVSLSMLNDLPHETLQNQEQERKQGNFLFQNSIQQFSGHTMSPKIPYYEDSHSDFSLPSAYSGCSDPYNDCASTFDTSSQYSSNYGDAHEYTEPNRYSRGVLSETEAAIFPDTPHNSIIHVNLSRNSVAPSDSAIASLSSSEGYGAPSSRRRSHRDEDAVPIVSGGVSIKDFTPKQCDSPTVRRKDDSCPIISQGMSLADFEQPKRDSPVVRRKTEACPIISLGMSPGDFSPIKLKCDSPSARRRSDDCPIISLGSSISEFERNKMKCDSPSVRRKIDACPIISHNVSPKDFEETKNKPIERPKTSTTSSWVVDMSDCNGKGKRRCSESSTPNIDNMVKSADVTENRNNSASSHKGLGFYVSLNDMKPLETGQEYLSKSLNYKPTVVTAREQKKKSTGFFVDLSESENSLTTTPPPTKNTETPPVNNDKKNMFTMFIDFGDDKKLLPKKDSSPKLSSSLPSRSGLIDMKLHQNGVSSGNGDRAKNYVFNESEPQVLPLRNHSSVVAAHDIKRHSWNTLKEVNQNPSFREHKRSISVSEPATEKGIMNILDKIPLISKTSSMSIETPNSPYDDMTCSKSLSSCSNNSLTSYSSTGGEVNDVMTKSAKRRQKDVKINETFDKSSQGSLTDGILSKNSSPTSTTDTEEVTFQNENDDFTRTAFMETIPEVKESGSPKKTSTASASVNGKTHTMESLQATIEKQKQLLDTVTEEGQMSSYVKLSDMDKPIQRFELHQTELMSKSVGSRIGKLFDATKSGNRNSWHSMSRSAGTNLTNLVSSIENLRSLSRIFPHLSKELSHSLPNDFDNEANNKSPNDHTTDLMHSDLSTSSATSSFSRSGIDSADEFSLSCRQPRRLGEDLLKMFLQEIATDVTIEVNGRRLKAHKCILRSRCQYFAAILAGGWVESAGNVISLSGYSYGSVHFALCHIYSGASHPPEGISLMELAALADLLGLEGLKEVTAHALKTNYCHNFHKPCSGCIEGILQVFPVALNQGLDDLYRKCLRWVCKHYMKVWTSRTFSQLPPDLITRCKQHIIAHMTSETVLQTLLDCDHLLALLAPCRWAISIEASVRDIIDAGQCYVSDHFASLLASDSFLSLGQGQSWNISRLENLLLQVGSTLTPDQACRSYQRVTRLNSVLNAKVLKMSSLTFDDNGYLNEYHVDDADEEMDWNPEFIRWVSAITSAVEQCLIRQCSRAMKISHWQRMDLELRKKIQKLACLSDPIERRPRSAPKPVTYNPVIPTNRSHDLYQVKLAIQAHSKRAQDGQTHKSTTNTQPIHERATKQNEKTSSERRIVDRAATTKKVSKSASKAQVPDLISTIRPKSSETKKTERNSASQIYRRSMSETNNQPTKDKLNDSSHNDKSKLSEIKSRYLEPKRQRNVLQNQTNLPLKGKTLSSTDSSRTTSPVVANRRKYSNAAGKQKVINDSITMSRDSLASPAKSAKANKITSSNSHEHEISVDSLAESMLSSVRTDRTISQESLVRTKDNNLKASLSRSNPMINKENHHLSVDKSQLMSKPINNKINKTKHLSSQAPSINSSTPSSVTMKSRLSSTSTISSPRDSYKGRQSAPVNSTTHKTDTRKSFLSARSKEILAKKVALKHSESTKSVPITVKDKMNLVNKSSSTSSILNRRSINIPTTLHLRRTAKLPESTKSTTNTATQSHLMNPTKSSSMKMVAQNNKTNKEKTEKKKITKSTKTESDVYSTDENEYNQNDSDHHAMNMDSKPIRTESKLERSSTFCKESSDLPTGELQIID